MRSLLVLLALTSPAAAAELTTVGDGGVREVDATCDVVLDGVIARVTMRHELRATGDGPVEASYRFALPDDAAIVGLAITPAGDDPHRATAVEAQAAMTPAVGRDVDRLTPDLGLLREVVGDGTTTIYELLVYPVAEDASTTVTITWVQPLTFADGRLGLRIPDRGDDLGAITGTVTVKPPAGVKKLRDLFVEGELVAAKPGKRAWPFVGDGALEIEVTPVLGEAVASFAAVEVADGVGALAVSLLRPRSEDVAAPELPEQVLFVLDVSASNATSEARDAMSTVVGSVLDAYPDAKFNAVLFDHAVRTLTPEFLYPGDTFRSALFDAIHDASGAQGTDLVAALAEAGSLALAETLVVIVTDGVLPTRADGESLETALGVDVGVAAVVLASEDRAVPDLHGTPLDELTTRHGGHVVAVRPSELASRARVLAKDLVSGASWSITGVELAGLEGLTLPETVSPGGGFVRFGWYEGKAPERIVIDAEPGAVVAKATKLPRVGALAVAASHLRSDLADEVEVGRKLGTVSSSTSLVAVDRDDELAAARLELGAKGGTFARIPPPNEGALDEPTFRFDDELDPGARYQLDVAGRIRADLIDPQLVPAARACFLASRNAGRTATGTVSLEIEIAGSEVIAARAVSTSAPELIKCLRESAYALAVPSYTLDEPETIYQIRYPLTFATKGDVGVGAGDGGRDPIDLGDAIDQPLGELTSR